MPCEIMALTIGTQLGSHEITALLGKGGMGEVYRARDLKLKREVAIKILPEEFSRDADRVIRFQREAEVLASLNHPNIAAIYDLEEANGSRFLVLELVEGETLADRIARGPIPIEGALGIAKQICEALEAAHERGIIHRDLKPGNVKITPDGKVKVLDFGLAKAIEGAPVGGTLTNSPTMLSGTMGGMILGTAPYMSPEQARGKQVDARTDIWAFGCVLYEMLTGQQTFTGETTTDVLAKVLEAQPKWEALPSDTPSSIRFLMETALNKGPKQRLQHIGDVRPLLNRPATIDKSAPVTVPARGSRRGWFAAAAALALALMASIPATLYFLRVPEEKTAIRFEMATPGAVILAGADISPDGQYVAYMAQADGKSAIWIRPIGEVQARPLGGTENGAAPFWSPDSRYIAFVADSKLKKISVTGGPATTLVETSVAPMAGTWNRDGVILFTSLEGLQPRLARVSESGGAVTQVGTTHRDGFDDVGPGFLPDGRHFLYISTPGPKGRAESYAGSLDGGAPVHIMSYGDINFLSGVDFPARYAAPGYLLFVRGGILMAQRFDEKRLALAGDSVPVAEHAGPFSVSRQQTLVYWPISAQETAPGTQQIIWMDRKGKRGPSVTMAGTFGSLRLSPDGHRLALDQRDKEGNTDLWLIDLDRGVSDRLTTDPAVDQHPIFSPDGKQVVFTSGRLGFPTAFIRPSVAIGTDQPLPFGSGDLDVAEDWSPPDGKYVVFVRNSIAGHSDIWVKPMSGDGKPFPFVQSSFVHGQPRVSPDGHWLAYMTNQTGTYQIVVKTFPDPNGIPTTVTANGGLYPAWRRDGRELYYLARDGKIMAVPVTEDGDKIVFGNSTPLFQSPLTVPSSPLAHQYDVNPEGTRFLFIANNSTNPVPPNDSGKLSVIVNWTATLRKK
jgi:Tol biopolymer transport system component